MKDKVYDLMDWEAIEAIIYSEESDPYRTLGPRLVEDGILIQGFFPGKETMMVKTLADGKNHRMTQEDEEGFFACVLPGKEIPNYVYVAKEGGAYREYKDPYAYPLRITEDDAVKFENGINYKIYEKLGAHPVRIEKTSGVYFAVWAPNALRVSVVGDFNEWDGRRNPMQRHSSGIYELFIPDLKPGELYKYEIKLKNGLTYSKADPYANAAEYTEGKASRVTNLNRYKWTDRDYIRARKKRKPEAPMIIYEVNLSELRASEEKELSYRELSELILKQVKETGYTHIQLLPMMEYIRPESNGFQTTGYYAPTSRYGSPEDFMFLVDQMHREGIGVILEWVPSYFPCDTVGLNDFDGTMLYEHMDPRQGIHPYLGTHLYNFGRPQVSNFLLANAMFWVEKYHIDGLHVEIDESMLYLDHGREQGQWVPNMFGGNENLEGLKFLKHLTSIMKKKHPDVYMIAKESTAWPGTTGDLNKEGLGFDLKWNTGWTNDLVNYLHLSPEDRKRNLDQLTLSMLYVYSERFILNLSHQERESGAFKDLERDQLQLALLWMLFHPGKKLYHPQMKDEKIEKILSEAVKQYKENPALHILDDDTEGFEWINAMGYENGILSFVRRSKDQELLIVFNVSDQEYSQLTIGVPREGKYKEIFNSDHKKWGGAGFVNPRIKASRKKEADGREDSIKIKAAPVSAAVFEFRKG